ncbi:MAG: type I restriction enzyme HsdR N-terminal domain-containing protein [Planctomycetaceae bacterium]
MESLDQTLAGLRVKIGKYRGRRPLNEENTKGTLVEPVLRALGWDVEDPEEVDREYRAESRDKPVDYALLLTRKPRLLVEAKALGHNLDDRRWVNQIMGYAVVAGVKWMVLTNGDEYRIYNTHADVKADEKLFRTVRVSEPSALLSPTLALLAKDHLQENRLEVLWRAQFVDQQVKEAIGRMLRVDTEDVVVRWLAKHTKNLSDSEIRESLGRCRLSLDFPEVADVADPGRRGHRDRDSGIRVLPGKRRPEPAQDVTLRDLIDSGVLKAPVDLVKPYKGRELNARVENDGTVSWSGRSFASLSTAGAAARASVLGIRSEAEWPATNGWTFWRCADETGRLVDLDVIRKRYSGAHVAGSQPSAS